MTYRSLVRALVTSAALVAGVLLAGCNSDEISLANNAKANQPVPPKLLADMVDALMDELKSWEASQHEKKPTTNGRQKLPLVGNPSHKLTQRLPLVGLLDVGAVGRLVRSARDLPRTPFAQPGEGYEARWVQGEAAG